MSSDIAISVQNVSKAYTIWANPVARLKYPLLRVVRKIFPILQERINKKIEGFYKEFYALRNISFEVKKGETIGIIGRNGSGKSTLLQMIVGTLQPSEGTVCVHGRIAALLELGSGFNLDFTGRQNVYLNASILGLRREEIESRFSDIEAFADIGDFIDQPVKTYSSGMSVRLAFAVQAMVDPDILIIDEALAVGDFFFQQKCAARMRELQSKGTTILFVSHDMGSVRDLCQKALYLKAGKNFYWGESTKAINWYFNKGIEYELEGKEVPSLMKKVPGHYLSQLRTSAVWWLDEADRSQKKRGVILGVIVGDHHQEPIETINIGERIMVKIVFLSLVKDVYHVAIEIKNRYDQIINSTSTYTCGNNGITAQAGELVEVEFYLDLTIEAGRYSYQLVLSKESNMPNRGERIDETPWSGPLEVEWDYEHQKAPFLGMFGIPARIQSIKKQKNQ